MNGVINIFVPVILSIDSTKLSVICAFNLHNFVADFLSVTVHSCRITTSTKKTQEDTRN